MHGSVLQSYTETLEPEQIPMDSCMSAPSKPNFRLLPTIHLQGCSLSQHSTFVFTWTIGKKPTSPHLSSCQLAGCPVCVLMNGRTVPKQPDVSWIHVIAHPSAEVLNIYPTLFFQSQFSPELQEFPALTVWTQTCFCKCVLFIFTEIE